MSGLRLSLTAEQRERVEALRAIYGDDPQAVGVDDGTEDDFGDLILEVLEALGYRDEIRDDERWQRVQDAAVGCDAEDLVEWAGVLDLAWKADPALGRALRATGSTSTGWRYAEGAEFLIDAPTRSVRVVADDGGPLVRVVRVGRGYSMRNGQMLVDRARLRET